MTLTRLTMLVVALLAGVALTVDAYVDTRRPLQAAPTLAETDRPTPAAEEPGQPARLQARGLEGDAEPATFTEA